MLKMKCILFFTFFVIIIVNVVKSNEEDDYFIPGYENYESNYFKTAQNFQAKTSQLKLFTQKLDNFNSTDNRTWSMRVQYNAEFFKPSGPIFIMIGGENPFSNNWLETGIMYDMAKENNAYMLYTEHRFYGGSFPVRSLRLEYLKYLTPDQALADIINIVHYYKSTCKFAESKVVVFGGSYAGNLALWIRSKYPIDIHAAVSSSAPLLAKFDFWEYHSVVQETLGSECFQVILRAIQQILQTLGSLEGAEKIKNDFHLCKSIDATNPSEIMYLLSIITTYFGGIVQNNGPNIHKMACNEILFPASVDEYTRIKIFLNIALGPKCKKGYTDFKDYISTTNVGNLRQWMYQSCTQFGFFQTSSFLDTNFLPKEMYQTWCKDFFGQEFDQTLSEIGIKRTNLIYGGRDPIVTRVVSVQGTSDPWKYLGLYEDLHPDAPVIIVNGTYHCQDLTSIGPEDSAEMKNAKLKVKAYIKKWLQEE